MTSTLTYPVAHLAGASGASRLVRCAAPAARHAMQPVRGCWGVRVVRRRRIPQQLKRPYAKVRLQLDQRGQALAAVQVQPALCIAANCFNNMYLCNVSYAFSSIHTWKH